MKKRFTGNTRIFLLISAAIVVIALLMQVFGAGINLGIDFTGGSLLTYSVGEDYDVEDVYKILSAAGYDEYQVTKTEASQASDALRRDMAEKAAAEEEAARLAAEETAEATVEPSAEATAEPSAEATAEPSAEATVEATAEPVAGMLNTDKTGIKQDGLTDLQIRLTLVDETEGLEKSVEESVKGIFPAASKTNYDGVTNAMVNKYDWDAVYSGGYVAEFEVGEEFATEGVADQITAYLTDAGFSIESVAVYRYDAAAEEPTVEPTAEADAGDAVEATPAPTEVADEAAPTEETGTSLRVVISVDDQTGKVRDMIETEMRAKYPDFVFVTIDHVSAVAGSDLIANALKALLIAFACMLIYIAIRFDFYSGVVALGALIHDVLIMCAFMVFFRGVFQANSPFIAAVLTIVGYSINNTIIIFDRIRETAKRPGFTQLPRADIVEISVTATLSRTINTSVTTLITLVCLFIFGVASIREFAFPLIVGMLAGTYSSVMLSGQVWAMWVEKRLAKKAAKKSAKA